MTFHIQHTGMVALLGVSDACAARVQVAGQMPFHKQNTCMGFGCGCVHASVDETSGQTTFHTLDRRKDALLSGRVCAFEEKTASERIFRNVHKGTCALYKGRR